MLSQQKTLKKKNRAQQPNQPYSYLNHSLPLSRWASFFSLIANNSKAAHTLWILISCCAICCFTFFFTQSYIEKQLPQHIVVHSSNQKAALLLEQKIKKLLQISRQNHDSRTMYLSKVKELISDNEMINNYLIRSGLDETLQIFITLQTPYLTLEDKGGNLFLVSRDLKIISKETNTENLKVLPTLVLPEVKINPLTFELATTKNKKTRAEKESITSFNLPWLTSTTQIILENMYGIGSNFAVKKVFWHYNSGFNILVAQGKNTISVELGAHEIAKKMERLKILLDHPQISSLKFTSIDLSFSDKATVLE